jgi:hypothetical protein
MGGGCRWRSVKGPSRVLANGASESAWIGGVSVVLAVLLAWRLTQGPILLCSPTPEQGQPLTVWGGFPYIHLMTAAEALLAAAWATGGVGLLRGRSWASPVLQSAYLVALVCVVGSGAFWAVRWASMRSAILGLQLEPSPVPALAFRLALAVLHVGIAAVEGLPFILVLWLLRTASTGEAGGRQVGAE